MRRIVILVSLLFFASTSQAQVVDFGPAFPGPVKNPRDQVFAPNSYSEDGFDITPNSPAAGPTHFDIYDRFQTPDPLNTDSEREILLHDGNSAESVEITSSGSPFSLLGFDVEVLVNGTAGWEVASSSGAFQAITGTGTTVLGPGFSDVTSVTIQRTVIPGAAGGGLWIDNLVFSVEELLTDLFAAVVNMNLQQGIANSLDAKFSTVMDALDDMNANNDVAAINALNASINAVEAQRGKKLTDPQADELVALATRIIALLEAGL